MNPLQDLQRQMQVAAAIETAAAVALLVLMIWGIVWTVKAFNRWERRDEAKTKALLRIAAQLTHEQPGVTPTTADDFRATR